MAQPMFLVVFALSADDSSQIVIDAGGGVRTPPRRGGQTKTFGDIEITYVDCDDDINPQSAGTGTERVNFLEFVFPDEPALTAFRSSAVFAALRAACRNFAIYGLTDNRP